jgi:hypothetical protein
MPLARSVVCVGLVMLAIVCAPAWAIALTVTNLNDSGGGSLRDTLAAAPPGATIDFAPGLTGSILLLSELSITQAVTIQGPGLSSLTLDATNAAPTFRAINIAATGDLTLSGVAIANGHTAALGGGVLNSGTFVVSRCLFLNNRAGNGGGISNQAGATLSVDECTFDTNTTTSVGGGAFINFGLASVSNSTFLHNTAPINGGAINTQSSGTTTIVNSTFFDGKSGGLGGALANLGTTTVINSTFVANQGSGGGVVATGNANVTLFNNVFSGNIPDVLSPDGGATASNNVFFNNGPSDQTGDGTDNFVVATTDPLLPLGNYGGPTLTFAPVLLGGATCAGSVDFLPDGLTRDQRGFPRVTLVSGGPCVDAGSVQGVTPAPVLSTAAFLVLAALLALYGFHRARAVTR